MKYRVMVAVCFSLLFHSFSVTTCSCNHDSCILYSIHDVIHRHSNVVFIFRSVHISSNLFENLSELLWLDNCFTTRNVFCL